MLVIGHVDEIDNNDAAQIAQPELPSDRLCSFKISFENRIVERSTANETADEVASMELLVGYLDKAARRTTPLPDVVAARARAVLAAESS